MDRGRKEEKDDAMSELVRSQERKRERMKRQIPGKRGPAGRTWFLFHRPMRSAELPRSSRRNALYPGGRKDEAGKEKVWSFAVKKPMGMSDLDNKAAGERGTRMAKKLNGCYRRMKRPLGLRSLSVVARARGCAKPAGHRVRRARRVSRASSEPWQHGRRQCVRPNAPAARRSEAQDDAG
jgi:hypothetical protein